ncbi:hypothetical protein ACWIGX_18955 [Streptomyces nigrescens]
MRVPEAVIALDDDQQDPCQGYDQRSLPEQGRETSISPAAVQPPGQPDFGGFCASKAKEACSAFAEMRRRIRSPRLETALRSE